MEELIHKFVRTVRTSAKNTPIYNTSLPPYRYKTPCSPYIAYNTQNSQNTPISNKSK